MPDGTTEWWAGECKTTGRVGRRSAPTGKGKIQKPSKGDQLSDSWLIDHVPKSGLSLAEQREFVLAIESGKVRRFYSEVTKDGVRFYNVERDGLTRVKLGDEITRF
jgi:hypothetical protein